MVKQYIIIRQDQINTEKIQTRDICVCSEHLRQLKECSLFCIPMFFARASDFDGGKYYVVNF